MTNYSAVFKRCIADNAKIFMLVVVSSWLLLIAAQSKCKLKSYKKLKTHQL